MLRWPLILTFQHFVFPLKSFHLTEKNKTKPNWIIICMLVYLWDIFPSHYDFIHSRSFSWKMHTVDIQSQKMYCIKIWSFITICYKFTTYSQDLGGYISCKRQRSFQKKNWWICSHFQLPISWNNRTKGKKSLPSYLLEKGYFNSLSVTWLYYSSIIKMVCNFQLLEIHTLIIL